MMQKINKMAAFAALVLLVTGRLSAMGYLKDVSYKALELLGKNKTVVTGVVIFIAGAGGVGTACVVKKVITSSHDSKGEKFVPSKLGEIAILEKAVRAKLGLENKEKLPKDVIGALFKAGEKRAYKQGLSKGWEKYGGDIEKLEILYPNGIPPKWNKECLGDYTSIYQFLDGSHPGYEEGEKTGEGNLALDYMYNQSDQLGILIAKEVFKDKTDNLPEDGFLKTYLRTQLDLLVQKHNEETKTELDTLKLLVAIALDPNYSGGIPSGDFGKLVGRWLKNNFISKNIRTKKSLKDLLRRNKKRRKK